MRSDTHFRRFVSEQRWSGWAHCKATNNDVSRVPVPFDVTGGIEGLGDVEHAATACLDRFAVPSPPATFLLAAGNLHTIKNGLTCTAMILRILRYSYFYEPYARHFATVVAPANIRVISTWSRVATGITIDGAT
ncbi:hypothetical protein OF83DRAFT_1176916 [Amylostereum chailletii]|nr:hypothetical protein OF83DRAFT_1176916 [Amylostereum chailletii]